MKQVIILLGAPGVGKGTQASKLCESLGFIHLSTGQAIRDAIAQGSELGIKVRDMVENGTLIPDELINSLIEEKLKNFHSNIILDGFPRTINQAEKLSQLLDSSIKLSVINIDLDEANIIQRLCGRRICPKCKDLHYHLHFNPPLVPNICDKCYSHLIVRPDDNIDVVKDRLRYYNDLTKPLLSYYSKLSENKACLYFNVDGNNNIHAIQQEILKKLGNKL